MTKKHKSFKFRIYPSAEQVVLLAKTFGCARFIYNRMLADKIAHYEQTGEILMTTPARYKPDFPWLREVDSLALCNVQLHLERAYANFFSDKKVGFPKFKSRKRSRNSYTTNRVSNNIVLADGLLKLPKMGRIKVKQHREIPQDYRLKSVTVSQTATGKYYASLLYEYEAVIQPVKPVEVVGLDYSMLSLYVTSEGQAANYPRYYRRALEKLAREQRKLSRRRKAGANREKQRLKVAKIHERIVHQRADFLHKQSRQIANVYDAVFVEDLDMQAMARALHFGKSVTDNGWGMFLSMLTYKLEEQGKQLIRIDKWYPSSKTCSCCGAVKKELHLAERTYQCEVCGFICDRDINAAINIRHEGLRSLA